MKDSKPILNRRHYERIPCHFAVVLNGIDETIHAESIDISEHGIRLLMERVPQQNSQFNLTFSKNTELCDLHITANLVWIRKNGDTSKYTSGFFFRALTKTERDAIYKAVSKYDLEHTKLSAFTNLFSRFFCFRITTYFKKMVPLFSPQ